MEFTITDLEAIIDVLCDERKRKERSLTIAQDENFHHEIHRIQAYLAKIQTTINKCYYLKEQILKA